MAEPARPPYRDRSLPIEKRVADLLGRMTLPEKLGQLTSLWLLLDPETGGLEPHPAARTADPAELLRHGIGQITRPFGSRPVEPRAGARALNALQRALVEGTRLGIPAIAHEECLTGFMAQGGTQFPAPLGYGATWDPELIERVGAAIRRQLRAVGAHQGLAPVCDVVRDPRWGRVEECVAEDPYLVGCVVSAYVRGLQGEALESGVIATLKHFAGYSFSEGGRNFAPAHVGPRELADVFLLPFEMAVKTAGALGVMNAYQDIDGAPAASSHWLLTELLRERWGFRGIVVSDYFAVGMLRGLHHVAEDKAAAATAALGAGLDVELPAADYYPEGLTAALERGELAPAVLDRSVARVLELKLRLGLFERPYVDVEAIRLDGDDARALAREVAERSIVLLANDGVLPLPERLGRLAVIGPNADDELALFGNYSFQNHVAVQFPDAPRPAPVPTLLDALRERLGAERVVHARGCALLGSGDDAPGPSRDTSGFPEAVRAAASADVAVMVVGDRAGNFRRGTVGEGTDTDDLALPGVQSELIDAVAATGTPTVVVLLHGRPFALEGVAARASAIVSAWFPGQEGAAAVADVLLGSVNPGGKTTVTFSRGAGVQPRYYNHKRLAAGIPPSPSFEPVFEFGRGLSYTRFEYDDLEVAPDAAPTDGAVVVRCTVRNAGERSGDEVVQLYLRDEVASVTRPVLELRGFRRVSLEPGAALRLAFRLPADLLSFTGPDYRRIVEPGAFAVMIGASSRDIRLEGGFRLTGALREVPEGRALLAGVEVEPA